TGVRRSHLWRGCGDPWRDHDFSLMASTSERRQGKAACSSPVRVFDALSGPSFWCAADECCGLCSVPLTRPIRMGDSNGEVAKANRLSLSSSLNGNWHDLRSGSSTDARHRSRQFRVSCPSKGTGLV